MNRKFQHLVEAVVYIAMHAKPNAVRGPEICESQGLPVRYLEADLQKLVRQGVLRSVRGPKGGYVLAKERRNITLADIYSAMDKEEDATGKESIVGNALKGAESQYLQELQKISIESLCSQSASTVSTRIKADFTI